MTDGIELLREWVRVALREGIDASKRTSDAATATLVAASGGKLRMGRRKDAVNRIYPTSPGAMDIKGFEALIRSALNPAALEIVPPNGSALGFTNKSGRFPVVLFSMADAPDTFVPIMLGQGANRGEQYESNLVLALQAVAEGGEPSPEVEGLIRDLGLSPEAMAGAKVTQTKPNPRRLTGAPYDVGAKIADIILTPSAGEPRYLSIKNLAGATFGNHGYGGGFVAKQGPDGLTIEPGKGPGDTDAFVEALGIDKELAAEGYTNYATQNPDSPPQTIQSADGIDAETIKSWLASGVGFGYYYVRETPSGGIDVKPILDAQAAEDFVGDVKSVTIRYPQGPKVSKQITAKVDTTMGLFNVEIRNSSGKIIPNELKLKIVRAYK